MAPVNTSFVDNPLIRAIGDNLGLDGLFSAASKTGGVTPPPEQAAKSRPNVAESRDLPTAQLRLMRMMQAYSASRNGGRQAMGGPSEPGVMDAATLQSPEVKDLLSHYGVDNNVNVDPHLFLHNPGAWANHPVLSGMLEGGLSGLAFTQGSSTWGEGLSNVARGLMASDAAHAERVNNQLMMPFQQASTIANLKAQQDEEGVRQATISRENAMAQYYNRQPALKEQAVNPIFKVEQDMIDALHKGDTAGYAKALSVYHDLEGAQHPQRQLPTPQGLNAARTDQWNKIKAKLAEPYGGDWNQVPESVAWPAYNDFLSAEKNTKFPPSGRGGGRTDTQSNMYRQQLIQQANDKINMVVGQLKAAGDDYLYRGEPIPGLKTTNGRVTAQALADYKNKVASDLNVTLTRNKMDPINARYTAEGTKPGAAPQQPQQGWHATMPQPINIPQPVASPRPSEQGNVPPVSMLKRGYATPFQDGSRWTLDDNGNPVKLPPKS